MRVVARGMLPLLVRKGEGEAFTAMAEQHAKGVATRREETDNPTQAIIDRIAKGIERWVSKHRLVPLGAALKSLWRQDKVRSCAPVDAIVGPESDVLGLPLPDPKYEPQIQRVYWSQGVQ